MKKVILLLSLILALLPLHAIAASDADVDRMMNYAVFLGRASACGVDTHMQRLTIGKWLDKTFPPGSSDEKKYIPIFVSGLKYYEKQQAMGQSPDSCHNIVREARNMAW